MLADLEQWGDAAEVKQSFGIFNGFHLLTTPPVILWLSAREGIREIAQDVHIELIKPVKWG